MLNKPCIHCKKPLNGGVFRKPKQCPHCMKWQDKAAAPNTPSVRPTLKKAGSVNSDNDEALKAALAARRAAMAKKSGEQQNPKTTPTNTARKISAGTARAKPGTPVTKPTKPSAATAKVRATATVTSKSNAAAPRRKPSAGAAKKISRTDEIKRPTQENVAAAAARRKPSAGAAKKISHTDEIKRPVQGNIAPKATTNTSRITKASTKPPSNKAGAASQTMDKSTFNNEKFKQSRTKASVALAAISKAVEAEKNREK